MPRKANPDRPEFAKLIAEAREQKHLSQLQLGQLIGRDTASIKKYEGGKVMPPFFILLKIADALSLNAWHLANLIAKTDTSGKWLDAAFEDIAWIFSLTHASVDYQHNSENINIRQGLRNTNCKKLDFLFVIANILQVAQNEYRTIVATKTDDLAHDILSGRRPHLESNTNS